MGRETMRIARQGLILAAVAAAAFGSAPTLDRTPAMAEGEAALTGQITAVYEVSLGNFNLGDFQITSSVRGGSYSMRGEGKFSILEGLVYKWHGVTSGAGRMTPEGPEPRTYAFSYSEGSNRGERLHMTFDDGSVQQVSIAPRRVPLPRTVPVRQEQLEGVVDPMSGAFLTARSPNPNGDLNVCNQLLPVFDGHSRFDLVLKPKKRVMVHNKASGAYSGPAAICHVKFVPISGYQPDNAGIRMMTQSQEIEVWLVPVKGTDQYVPYRVVLPTPVGYGTATAKTIRATGMNRASAN